MWNGIQEINMAYKQEQRNRPISSLIKWYLDKKSGKVSDARKEIQKRYDYLDWKDQKRIALAFLQSGKSDREWAYGKIYRQWDESYFEPVKKLWEEYHEFTCAWSVIQHFPIDYVKDNAGKLEEVNGYYHLCQRLAEDSSYKIDKHKLLGKEYLLVMLNAHRKVSEEEARNIFFESLHKLCLSNPDYFFQVRQKARGYAFSVTDIDLMNSIMYLLQLLELHNLYEELNTWNQRILYSMYNSEEFKELEKMVIDDSTYNQRRLAIGLKFLYSALDDRYKKDEDEELINKLYGKDGQVMDKQIMFNSNRQFPLYDQDPKVLNEMIARNPALANLISAFDLSDNNLKDKEEIPF